MSRGLLLCVAIASCLGVTAPGAHAALRAQAAEAAGLRVRLSVEPAEVEVGEPFELVLTLDHPAALVPVLPGDEVAQDLDPSWVFLGVVRSPTASAAAGRRTTRRAWRLASLEPGARRVPPELVTDLLPEGASVVSGAAPMVTVRGVLAEGEDEPRPLRGIPPGFAQESGLAARAPWLPWAAGLGGAALLATLFVVARRRRRRADAASGAPSAAERLEALAAAPPSDPEARRAETFELCRLVRAAVDAKTVDAKTVDANTGSAARSRAGLTDEEWLSAVRHDQRLPTTARSELAAFFEEAAAVKYGGERPSAWARDERLARARSLVVAVAAAGNGRAPVAANAASGEPEAAA